MAALLDVGSFTFSLFQQVPSLSVSLEVAAAVSLQIRRKFSTRKSLQCLVQNLDYSCKIIFHLTP